MAKLGSNDNRKRVVKGTRQNGSKTSTMNKTRKSIKKYQGQGR